MPRVKWRRMVKTTWARDHDRGVVRSAASASVRRPRSEAQAAGCEMNRRIPPPILVVAFLMLWQLVMATTAKAQPSVLVVDAGTGRTLRDSGADKIRYPASLTKMMTLYLLFEALDRKQLKLSSRMKVSRTAAVKPPTALGLRAGQTISVHDAILAITTKSANDMAALVAETLAGDENRFAYRMTRKARSLGMNQTTFGNASGLPHPAHRTTARDMSRLARALLRHYPHYYPFFGRRQFTYAGAVHPNHNRLLGIYRGMDGIKTGYTRASGYNLVASARRNGRRLIGVVMGSSSPAARNQTMTQALDSAFGTRLYDAPRRPAKAKSARKEEARNQYVALRDPGTSPTRRHE